MNIYPKQKISYKDKMNVEAGAKYSSFGISMSRYFIDNIGDSEVKREMQSLMRVAEGHIDLSLYKYVLNPYNTTTGKTRNYPAKLRNYDILSPVIQSFLGENSKKPDNYQVVAVNEDAPNIKNDKLQEQIRKVIEQQTINELNELGVETGVKSEEGTPDTKEAKKSFSKSYVDERAVKGQETLNILKYDLNLKDKIQKAFYYWLILGRVITYKEINRNDVDYSIIYPGEMTYSKSPNSDFIEDGNWASRKFKMNINDVVDKWRDRIPEDDIDMLEATANSLQNVDSSVFSNPENDSTLHIDEHGLLDVYHFAWKSLKKIGILKYYTELGEEKEMEVSEDYKLSKLNNDISITWEWINEVWECYSIEDSIILDLQPIPMQRDEMNNTSICKLPYNGRSWRNTTESIKSTLKDGLPYQMLYNIYHYRAEMTMARNKDKMLLMPIGAIPKKWGKDAMDNFMYYAESTGIAWIDESQPGVMAALQAIKAIDMSLSQYFASMHDAMQSIKQEWWDSVGMNRQRFGDTKASDGKGTNEQAIFRSSVITEELFRQFNKVEELDLNGLIDYSKYAWIDGKRGAYISSDGRNLVYNIDGAQHMETQYNIFAKDQSKENEKLQTMKNISLTYAQNGAQPGTIAEILDSESFSTIKTHLNKLDEITQERQEAESKAVQESNERIERVKAETSKAEREMEKYKVDMSYKEAIDVKKLEIGLAKDLQQPIPETDDSLNIMKEGNKHSTENRKIENIRRNDNEKNNIKREEIASNERISLNNKNQYDK